ncbi:winged helix-turn-helix domain-containing protein [Pseudoduganella aquatica]|uniref:Response regulator n=1 Tax=Pseudoduganella aquatica TaxID=2660641 RepID=A0A7X4KLK1_9BURK|nr:winged helix-turn-helix domain-containing protein [Pseudoduganella aquatica]MYN08304.1 response regulator [Pseudoduganella aquatica]
MPSPILIIDCDPQVQQLLALNLRQAGHQPLCALDAESALLMMETAAPALLLLEWDLPGQSGLSLLRRLRAQPRTEDLPVIMLTARAAEADKIMALESGADDYITKPFSPRETLARMHAVLRRQAHAALHAGAPDGAMAGKDALQLATLRLDAAAQRVVAGGRQLSLGRVEFRLLHFLMRHPERVYSRAQLLDLVWGADACLDERTVDTHVGRLRSALQPSGYHDHIETVRGSGYRFTARVAAVA